MLLRLKGEGCDSRSEILVIPDSPFEQYAIARENLSSASSTCG
jgi:hypothetical protein